MQHNRTGSNEPDRWAIGWVGEHSNYPEFQLIWTTMASLTVVQYQTLAEQWADTADRRLARGLALRALAPLRGNLAAVTIRFLDIFTLPLPPAELRDDDTRMLAWLPTLATELPAARPAAALHDAMLASLAFPTISGDDDAGLREPWARVCLPCPFEPAAMFGDASPAVAALLAGCTSCPKPACVVWAPNAAGSRTRSGRRRSAGWPRPPQGPSTRGALRCCIGCVSARSRRRSARLRPTR